MPEAKVMAPSIHTEISPELEVKKAEHSETLVLEPRKTGQAPAKAAPRQWAAPEEGSFQSSMLEYNRMKGGSRLLDALISLAINMAILTAPIFVGLYFTDTLNLKQLESTFLVAGKLVAPSVIPKNIADIREAPLPPDVDGSGVAGGVPGGVAGGSMGGVIGGVIGGTAVVPSAPIAPRENQRRRCA
jgi:hypothetical protein